MKVSVVVPVYNVEKYLNDCLDSLINQTLEDIEIICVNDGSTDNSLAILEKYQNKDNRIQIITRENGGLSAARNTGMEYTKGEYISFIDSDDWIELDTYEILYEFAKSKDLDILMFPFNFYNDDTGEIYQTQYNSLEVIDSSFDEKIFNYKDVKKSLFKISHSAYNKIYKSSFLSNIDAHFEEGLNYEDIPFFFLTFLNTDKVSIIRKSLYLYRIRDGSITTSGSEESYGIFKILTIFLNLMKEKNLFEELKQDILMYLIVNIKFVYIRLNEKFRNDFFELIKKNYYDFNLNEVDEEELKKWHFEDRAFYLSIHNSNNGTEFNLNYKLICNEFTSIHFETLSNELQKENERLLEENNKLKNQINNNLFKKIRNTFKK
ncbi:glycosyltransferase [Methanobrevibacter sp. OttesenSCG-928-K11]|nr:glycosyltransferase [Methanobrevibacter sp. OttesenSCG-928-K11]MDL2270399.1 glycosyltransferase [Methanobrevibacter sp. OttesenSCG-928-I08]